MVGITRSKVILLSLSIAVSVRSAIMLMTSDAGTWQVSTPAHRLDAFMVSLFCFHFPHQTSMVTQHDLLWKTHGIVPQSTAPGPGRAPEPAILDLCQLNLGTPLCSKVLPRMAVLHCCRPETVGKPCLLPLLFSLSIAVPRR